jgi:tetratricopeptide (TPR) repeat protein
MSSAVREEMKQIKQLIFHGKFKESLEVINESLNNKEINKEDRLRLLIYKCESIFYLGDWLEALQIAEFVLKENEELSNELIQADALIWKAFCITWDGDYNTGVVLFENHLEMLSKLANVPEKEISKRKAFLLQWSSIFLYFKGDYEKALNYAEESVTYAKASEYSNRLSQSWGNLGIIQGWLDPKNAIESCENAIKIATEINNDFLIGMGYGDLGTVMWEHYMDHEKALECYDKCYEIAEKTGCDILNMYKTITAYIYRSLNQLDKALEFLHTSLRVSPWGKHIKFAEMGRIHFFKCNFEQALYYYLESMRTSEEIKDKNILPFNLSNLVTISLELNDLKKAKEYLKQIKDLMEETGDDRIKRIYRFTSISVLKATGNVSDLAEATKLLNEFLAEKEISSDERLDVLYSLLEIKLRELYISSNEEKLKEVQKRLHHLEVEAEQQQQLWLLANVYRLQAQLSLVEYDANAASELLDKAKKIADEIEVELLNKEIQNDRDKIQKQLLTLQNFQKQQAPISETVKIIPLENSVQKVKRETMLEKRNEETGNFTEYRKLFALKI